MASGGTYLHTRQSVHQINNQNTDKEGGELQLKNAKGGHYCSMDMFDDSV